MRCPECGHTFGRPAPIDWAAVDWTMSNPEIADQLGVSKSSVNVWRRKIAPHTIRRLRSDAEWQAVDWSKSSGDLVRSLGVTRQHLLVARRKYAPETVKTRRRKR